ncbi:MAG: S9 family peptidase [Myxococcales bacterium]|nr:S9 family peptidase [Myxococcales bacterium]
MESPPVAPQKPHVHSEHGRERSDPWFWMRQRDSPEVLAHLQAENVFTEARTAHLADLRKQLFEEMLARVQEDDTSAPVPDGPWEYYTRTFAGKAYSAFCRRPRGGGDEQVMLDVNELAETYDYVRVANVQTSPDHRVLAYAVDTDGGEKFQIRFRDLQTGTELPDRVAEASPYIVWAADSATVLWVARDEAWRPDRVFRRVLGQPDDELVYHEPDGKFRAWISDTLSGDWIMLGSSSSTTDEVHLLSASAPTQPPRCIQPRIQGLRYDVADRGDELWILTNDCPGPDGAQTKGAENMRLMRASLAAPGREHWEEVLGHRDDVELVSVVAFANHLVRQERSAGVRRLWVRDLRTGSEREVPAEETLFVQSILDNREVDATSLRFGYDSFTRPFTVYEYSFADGGVKLVKQTATPGYDPSQYVAERRLATAPDGTEVPMSLMYRRDTELTPDTPMKLYGYGSYGHTIDPRYVTSRVSLLDRGMVFAIPHVRGSSYHGRPWYEGGKLQHKQNTFSDFIACGRALHASGVSRPERTVLGGGSAGGLLMGAVINQAPDLAKGAVASVPFVDVVTTMLDESIPLTAGEWEEWGDPREPEPFAWMLAYSPYDNVAEQRYPALLVTAGLNDPRVQYWEPAKWVAKLRTVALEPDVLFKVHMGAGHAGRSGRYGYLEDRAFDYAWVLDQLGLA